jgi:Flp pilus assembly protein protease CpaA
MTTAATLAAFLLLGTGLIWLVIEDIRRFEISPAAAVVTAGAIIALRLLCAALTPVVIITALCALAFAAAVNRFRPAALGQGDITLFALIGLAAGLEAALPAALTYGAASAATALAYLIVRQKPKTLDSFQRHAFPAAPAGAAAILAGLLPSLS